ncbi:hypothetical protein KR038_001399 [Drosophila bunnanda]|nr:hypothetical protein KR038_001399 [Drosophila bunnanda]
MQPNGFNGEKYFKVFISLDRYRPEDATPIQFYNCVKDMCAKYNCGLLEAIKRAQLAWPECDQATRENYKFERPAETPLPRVRFRIRPASLQRPGPSHPGCCRTAVQNRVGTSRSPGHSKFSTIYTVVRLSRCNLPTDGPLVMRLKKKQTLKKKLVKKQQAKKQQAKRRAKSEPAPSRPAEDSDVPSASSAQSLDESEQ